jgi:thiol-disulfide isomerase/thioredoxin
VILLKNCNDLVFILILWDAFCQPTIFFQCRRVNIAFNTGLDQTMALLMVGGYPEQKKGDKALWIPLMPFFYSIYYYPFYYSRMNYRLICVIVPILFSCAKTEKRIEAPKPEIAAPAPKPKSEIPELWMSLEDGSKQLASTLTGKTVLFLFQPDCDHCQREAVDIKRYIDNFKDYQLYFISSAPLPEVLKFAKEYELKQYPNIHWGTTTVQNIISTFGPIEAPSLYLYSNDGKLIESFVGEIAVEVIVKHL